MCRFLFVLLYVAVLALLRVEKSLASLITYEVEFGLSNMTTDSVDMPGINALIETIKKTLDAENVVYLTQSSIDNPQEDVTVYVLISTSNPVARILLSTIEDGTFTYVLQYFARQSGASGMSDVKADYATPSQLNFDGRHDAIVLRTGDIVGIVLVSFFGLLCCCFCGFMYLKHRSDFDQDPGEPHLHFHRV